MRYGMGLEILPVVKTLAALPEVPSSISSNHTAGGNYLYWVLMTSSDIKAFMQIELSYIRYISKF